MRGAYLGAAAIACAALGAFLLLRRTEVRPPASETASNAPASAPATRPKGCGKTTPRESPLHAEEQWVLGVKRMKGRNETRTFE